MQRRTTTFMLGLSVFLAPGAAIAQTSIALHASRGSTPDPSWLYGATLGAGSHGFGLRVGGAMGYSPVITPARDRDLLWLADADVVLAPTLWGGADGRRSVVPYAFAGAGLQPRAGDVTVETAVAHWSWGGGLTVPIVSSLSLMGEARSRTLLDRNAVGAVNLNPRSTEFRAGIALSFGGSSARRSVSEGTRRRPAMTIPRRPSIPGSAVGTRVLPTARQYLGVKYRYGGTSPTTGFDCSGFVQYVFARHDAQLPRTSRAQAGVGTRVDPRLAALRAGDLMFFAERGERVSHVAIYAGDNRIIHSTSSGGEVRYDDLSSSRGHWFATRLVGARRITSSGAGLADLVRALESGTFDVKDVQLDPPDRAPRPR